MKNARDDVTDLLPESPAERPAALVPTGREHRKFRRYYFRTLATATIYSPKGNACRSPQVCYVLTRDLSRSGISFLHPVSLPMRQAVDLCFPSGQKLLVEIHRIEQLEPDCFLFGCKLRT
jgi:hypothetical protein